MLAIVLGCGAGTSVAAQTFMPPTLTPRSSASALADAAFAPRSPVVGDDEIGRLLDRETYVAGEGLARWNSGEVQLSNRPDGPVDSLRVGVGGPMLTPGGLPFSPDRAEFAPRAYEVTVVRDWPGAVSFATDRFGVDLSPHAGVGMTSSGTSAEAGARLELSRRLDDTAKRKLQSMGVRDGASFGDQGRWYLFAAASGRAVGLNMLRNDGAWDRAGWTTDPTSTLVGDAQVGVGWRKGIVQTSLGYMHREVKGQHMVFGQDTRQDSMVAFTLSIKPRR
ncbi:DUF2219 domain-containing protein [Phenylobacterium hankyongense]|uniref:DUF2219 domain-containing protein n=2 Tax=Phenylobacterium hankyongense TaxID=1813876 RepID=A0A328B0B7_9CAUL|nr:DUF2219 domain-containing protein [Phenylobacterium hankyongense]